MAEIFDLATRLSSVGEYYFSRKLREIDEMRRGGADILSLGIGSPDLPPHPSVMERLAVESAKPSAHGYQSYRGGTELRNAFSQWYNERFGTLAWCRVHYKVVSSYCCGTSNNAYRSSR